MNRQKGPGFAVLYRWRLHPEKESQFIEAWSQVSEKLLLERGSLGSRLHKGNDGLWYSYAQWPSAAVRKKAFSLPSVDTDALAGMQDAVAESLPEIILESVSDFMVSTKSAA